MVPYQTSNLLTGCAQQPINYSGYNSNYPQRKLQESANKHPLIYEERLTVTCRTCKGDAIRVGYKCDVYRFIFDMRCSDNIFL